MTQEDRDKIWQEAREALNSDDDELGESEEDVSIEELEQQVKNFERASEKADGDQWETTLQNTQEELLTAKKTRVEELNRYIRAAALAPEKRKPKENERKELRGDIAELESTVEQ